MARHHGLSRWVVDHRVTWEVLPRRDNTGRLGYTVVLYARHPPIADADPGCAECRRIYGVLAALAHRSPLSRHDTHVSIAPFDAAFRLRQETGWAPEIQLEVGITPRSGDDAAALRSVRALEGTLRDLGVQQGRWREPP